MANPDVFIAAVNGTRPLSEWLVPGHVAGQPQEVAFDLVATADHSGTVLFTSEAGWLEVTLDGGSSWVPVGADLATGVTLPAVAAGSRTLLRLRITGPTGLVRRRVPLALSLGLGS